jgi:murein DD-endopeptidase MepM/ murein hydrolase activator NlpD
VEEVSFDPRSWARRRPQPEKKAGLPGESSGTPTGEALPEAWRSIAVGLGTSGGDDARSAEAKRAPFHPMLVMSLLSACLLAGGGVWAHLTRQAAGTTIATVEANALPKPALPDAVERSLNLSGAGELAAAMAAVGMPPAEAEAAAAAASAGLSKPGGIRARMVMVPAGEGFSLQRLQASYLDGSGVVVTRDAAGKFQSRAIAAELTRQIKVLRGELDSESFYTSAVSSGLIDALIPEFINAFAYDFNLASEVSPGDTFEVAYQQSVNEDGEPVGQPQLLFASLTTQAKSLALYRFVKPDGEVGWFDGNGASTKRGFMRTPVDGARISSKFGMRFHPVLHYNKLHGGVDFAAPTGTPIYAAADGVVEFAAYKGANGNLTVVRHDNGWRTLYLHQNRFSPGIAPSVRVTQGQHIGDIGTTGRSTGPHLHYEVHIEGRRIDPLTIKTADSERKRIEGAALAAFRRERDRVDVARAQELF